MTEIFDTFIKGGEVSLFGKFVDKKWFLLGLLAAIVLIAVISVLVIRFLKDKKSADNKSRSVLTVKTLVTGAMCIGMAFILSYIKLWDMPQGGAITPASCLPIILFAYIYGWKPGLLVSFTYSLLQIIQSPQNIMSFPQALLDYVIAFTVLGIAGFFTFRKSIVPAVVTSYVLRYLAHVLAGIFFYMEYNETSFSGVPYCFLYNAVFILPEMVLCIVIVLIPPMTKLINKLRAQHNPIKEKTA